MVHTLRPLAGGALFERLAAVHPALTAFRRDLHAHPELGFEERRTSARVAEALRVAAVDEVHTGIGRTGVVAIVRGRSTASGRAIGLRADMDALPIREETESAWRSTRSGVMHACGHDGHTTMLLGAARALAETRAFDGTAVLVFQPGEEGHGGAQAMIDDGLFHRFPVDAIYAMHNWPALPAGTIGVNPGPMMAAADRVEITVEGRGGHGAHPYLAVDPVLVAAHLIAAAQSLVSRNVSPLDHAVVSLCAIQAGDLAAFNVIPRLVRLSGTVRSFRREVQDMIEQRLTALSHNVAQAFGATATVDYRRSFPATVNTPELAHFAAEHGRRGLRVHAPGAAGRLPAARAGRRGRLLPARLAVRFQRRGAAARRRAARVDRAARAAARRMIRDCLELDLR
jgi:amidohydrolase